MDERFVGWLVVELALMLCYSAGIRRVAAGCRQVLCTTIFFVTAVALTVVWKASK